MMKRVNMKTKKIKRRHVGIGDDGKCSYMKWTTHMTGALTQGPC